MIIVYILVSPPLLLSSPVFLLRPHETLNLELLPIDFRADVTQKKKKTIRSYTNLGATPLLFPPNRTAAVSLAFLVLPCLISGLSARAFALSNSSFNFD